MRTEHWKHSFELDPTGKFGFIYEVVHKATGKFYIGMKQYYTYRKTKVPGRKTKKLVTAESNWKTYTSSSKQLNAEIKEQGMEAFEFTILAECQSKWHLRFLEASLQHGRGCLYKRLPDGSPASYNNAVLSVFRGSSNDQVRLDALVQEQLGLLLDDAQRQQAFVGGMSDEARENISAGLRENSRMYDVVHAEHGRRYTSIPDLIDEFPELDQRRMWDMVNEKVISNGTGRVKVRRSYKGWKLCKNGS